MKNKLDIEIGTPEKPTCGACKHWSLEEDGWCGWIEDSCHDSDPYASECGYFSRHPDSSAKEDKS